MVRIVESIIRSIGILRTIQLVMPKRSMRYCTCRMSEKGIKGKGERGDVRKPDISRIFRKQ